MKYGLQRMIFSKLYAARSLFMSFFKSFAFTTIVFRKSLVVKIIKNIAYLIIVVLLFGTTFIPQISDWQASKFWISTHFNVLALLGTSLALYAFRPTFFIIQYIGKIVHRLDNSSDRVVIPGAAVVFFSLTYYLSGDLFGHMPAEMDSMAQYAGAKYLPWGIGRCRVIYCQNFLIRNGFSMMENITHCIPPGHMMLLAIGHLLGKPAIINPLLGAASLVATYFLTLEIGGRSAARMSLVLFLVSPFIVFLSSEYDNRATALLCATLFALFYVKAVKYNRNIHGLLCGMALGYFVISRPQAAAPFALPFALYSLWLLAFNIRNRWKIFAMMIAGIIPFLLFFLYYNSQTTGDYFLTGYQNILAQALCQETGSRRSKVGTVGRKSLRALFNTCRYFMNFSFAGRFFVATTCIVIFLASAKTFLRLARDGFFCDIYIADI